MDRHLQYCVKAGGVVGGRLRVPGDKSISHRAIILGAIAVGVTEITGFLEGEDTLRTLQAFRDMGVAIQGPKNGMVSIQGVGLHGLKKPAAPTDLQGDGRQAADCAGAGRGVVRDGRELR